MKKLIRTISVFGILLLIFSFNTKNINEKPHIIFIMTDQQRGDAIGCIGNQAIFTPQIDQIASAGVVFTSGYSSVPSCTPARAGLLTGMSPWKHGMLGYGRIARKYKYEMPQMLKELGYYTFGIGKMHWFPQKALHGFHGTLVDESGRVEQDGFVSDYRDWFKLNAPGEDPDKTGIGWNDNTSGVYQLEEKLHPTYWTGKTAVEFIKNYSKDNPLFLKVSFARPHSPYDPPQRYLDMYDGVDIPEPVIGGWAANFASAGNQNPSTAFGDWGKEYAVKARRHYYANITFIDDMVGEIIQALKEKGMYDNSVICFTSDHGDMLGDHHHWRKTYAYEGSAKIPYILKWPENLRTEVKRGEKLTHPVELRDFLPTFIDAAGGEIPTEMDGMSLFDLVEKRKAEWRPYLDLEHATAYSKENYWCALTDGKMKYIWFFSTGEEQLFNLTNDPMELVDLSDSETGKDALLKWRQRMVDHLFVRGEEFVKDGKLVVKENTTLYSPNYPEGEQTISIKEWGRIYKGILDNSLK